MAKVQQTITKKLTELNDKEISAFTNKYGKGNIKPESTVFMIEGGTNEKGEKINVTIKIAGIDYEKGKEEGTAVAKKEGLPDFTYRKLEYEPAQKMMLQDEDEDIQMQVKSVGEGFTKKSKVTSFSEFLKS